MQSVVELLESEHGVDLLKEGDVPHALKTNGKMMPLGRYLRRQIRKRMGIHEDTPEEILLELRNENVAKTFELWKETGYKENTDQAKLMLDANKQRVRNIEKKASLYKQQRSI